MGRPVNEKMKGEIETAAYRLFEAVGYDKSTYAAIADAVGISRNLVQYHFPKKEMLAISYMEKVLEDAQSSLGIGDEDIVNSPQSCLVDIGTRFFDSLLESEGKREFLKDIIRSRDLTEDVLAFNSRWAFEHLSISERDPSVSWQTERSVLLHMGGFYELLYHSLKTGESIDIERELGIVVDAFLDSVAKSTGKE